MADFYSAYNQRRQQIEGEPTQQLQQASAVVGLQQALQQQAQSKQLQDLLSTTGGDAEKALAAALQSGNIEAAQHLAPIVKMQQEQKQREDTPRMLAEIYRQSAGPQAQQAAPVAPDFPTANPQDAMVTPAGPAPSQQDWRQKRLAQLTAQSLIPQYANNPVVYQKLQSEMDKLSSVKPMVEHNFSIGENMVQPHISFDEGKTWEPIKGSKPSAKFAKQVPDEVPGPTADTLEMDAWRYLTDGTLPPNMGRGAQGSKIATDIRNRSAALAKEMGMEPDEIRMAQLTNKTQVQAIGQLAKAKAQILQFEKTASMNADLALQASDKVDRTGVPVLNRWLQAGRTNIAGDVEASKFHAATETFVSEYAKVMSGGYGAAATTEGAQNRAHSLLNTANTKDQFNGVVTQLKAEMNNRVKALNAQMAEEKQNLRSGIRRPPADAAPTGEPGPAPANPAMPDIKGAATQAWGAFEPDKFEYRMSNGKLQRKAK